MFPAYTTSLCSNPVAESDANWLQNESCPPEVGLIAQSAHAQTNLSIESDAFLTEVKQTNNDDRSISKKNTKKKKYKSQSKLKKHKRKKNISSSSSEGINELEQSHKRKKSDDARSRSRSHSLSKKSCHKKRKKKSRCKSQSYGYDSVSSVARKENEDFELLKTTTLAIVERSKSIFLDGILDVVSAKNAFFLCHRGDQTNIGLPATQATHVPRFNKSKIVLGEAAHSRKKKERTKRYYNKGTKAHLLQRSFPIFPIEKKAEEPDASRNFVPLDLTWVEETKALQNSKKKQYGLGVLDSATEAYSQGVDISNLFDVKEEDIDVERSFWQQKVKQYNEELNKNPSNVELWQEFVGIQDKSYIHLLQIDKGKDDSKTRSGVRSHEIAERKISILDNAIKKNIRSLELHFERLAVGEDIWHNKQLRQEWEKLLVNFPANLCVWSHFLVFHLTHSASFKLPSAIRLFGRSLERCNQMRKGTFLSHSLPDDIGYHMIDLVKEISFVWYQGGHLERAIANFQALIEINFFCPEKLKSIGAEEESKLALFEVFWDCRAPRFGEKESVGWAKYMETMRPVVFPEVILGGLRDEEDDILAKGGSNTELWIEMELSRELLHWLPWPEDPEYCEDPERMVNFDTIKNHLFFLDSEPEMIHLLKSFIAFLGVPTDSHADSLTTWREIIPENFDYLRLEAMKETLLEDEFQTTEENHNDLFRFPVIGPSLRKPSCQDYFTFVLNVIRQAIGAVSTSYKSEFAVLFVRCLKMRCRAVKKNEIGRMTSNVSWFRKQIKNLLKMDEFRNDIVVYYEFALFEQSVGAYTEASKICTMTIMSSNLSYESVNPETKRDKTLFKHLYLLIKINILLEENTRTNCNAILNLITSFATGSNITDSPAAPNASCVLKARRKLTEIRDANLDQMKVTGRTDHSFHFVVAFLAILELLTMGWKASYAVFEESIHKAKLLHHFVSKDDEDVSSDSGFLLQNGLDIMIEHLYEDFLWLMRRAPHLIHLTTSMFVVSPSTLRGILKDALNVAPKNEFFQELASGNQSWRDILLCGDLKRKNNNVLDFIYRLLPHIRRTIKFLSSDIEGSISSGSQMENILEMGVSSRKGRHCPLLWRLYLRIVKVIRPKSVKEVAYRALTFCPGVKCLYLDCVRIVPDIMDDIIKLMSEKGIRVRLPLEELRVLLDKEQEDDEDFTNSDPSTEVRESS